MYSKRKGAFFYSKHGVGILWIIVFLFLVLFPGLNRVLAESGEEKRDKISSDSLTLVGSWSEPGVDIKGLDISGNYAYLADYTFYSPEFGGKLRIVDISDPSAPVQVGSADVYLQPYEVKVVGSTVFVETTGGTQLVDISDPFSPEMYLFLPFEAGHMNKLKCSGLYAYGLDYLYGFNVMDLSTMPTPYVITSLQWSEQSPQDLCLFGDYAYVADLYKGIEIIDISDPTTPSFAGYKPIADYTYSLDVWDSYLYILSREGLEIVDIWDPLNPWHLSAYWESPFPVPEGEVFDVAGKGGCKAFLAGGGTGGIHVIDFSDRGNPVRLDSSQAPEFSWEIFVTDDGYAYVASGPGGLSVFDVSAYNSCFSLTSPRELIALESGTQQEIRWLGYGHSGDVMLEYSTDPDVWLVITSSTENDGSYWWTVPQANSNDCYVRVSLVDGSLSDMNDMPFYIYPANTVITVTSPNGGEIWAGGSIRNITWSTVGAVSRVKIDYSTDEGSSWTIIVPDTPNDGSYEWSVPNTPSTRCLVRISDVESPYGGVSSAVFTILPQKTITVTSPNGGERWYSFSTVDITWNSTGEIFNVAVDCSYNSGSTWLEIVAAAPNTGSYSWEIPEVTSPDCLIRIHDIDSPASDISDSEFEIVVPPRVTVTSPNGDETWYVGSVQTITWTSSWSVDNVAIDYTINGGDTWIEVTASIPNTGSYNWTVPDTPSPFCNIRVRDTASSASHISEGIFTILSLPTITVTAPNGGENWYEGSVQTVTWTNTGTINNVAIHYSTDGGSTWNEITASTSNTGSYNWTVPDTPSADCSVRVRDTVTLVSDTGDAAFTILPLPTITVTSPNGGETWYIGSKYTITWTGSETSTGDTTETVAIDYSTDGGSTWDSIVASTANTGSYKWTVPNTASSNCQVRISDTDSPASDTSDAVFTIAVQPAVTVTSPNGGETLTAGSSHTITWDSVGGIIDFVIEYSIDRGVTWQTAAVVPGNTSTYDWVVPDTPSTKCFVRVTGNDSDDSVSDISDSSFTIKTAQEPFITVTSPNGGENWTMGSVRWIKWFSSGAVDDVKIECSLDSGQSWDEIINSTSNSGEFEWTVPDTPSENCRVRVSAVSGTPADTGDADFSIRAAPTITLTSPNGGENWEAGSSQTITWVSTDFPTNDVHLEYSTDAGTAWNTIAISTDNDGSYEWMVPDTPSGNCLVRVSSSNSDEVISDISDNVFSISAALSGAITVTSPAGGENWYVGSTYTIGWSSVGVVGDVKIEYSVDGGSSWDMIVDSTPNDGSYYWTAADNPSDNCMIRVSDISGDISGVSGSVFSIVSPDLASITVVSPVGGENLEAGSDHEIQWTNTGIIDNVTIDYSIDNGTTWEFIVESTINDGGYTWIVPGTLSDQCLVRIRGGDFDSGPSDVSDETFSIVSNVNTITVTSPNGGEVLEVGSAFDITWTTTGNIESVTIEYSTDGEISWKTIVSATVSGEQNSFQWIIPDEVSEECRVRISGTGSDNAPWDTCDGEFAIIPATSPFLHLLSPNGGENWQAGLKYEINWSGTGDVETIKIEYSVDNGQTWEEIIDSTPNTGNYEWLIPDTPSADCLVRISDPAGEAVDNSNGVFSIVTPVSAGITVTSPNGGETLTSGSGIDITWTSNGIDEVIIEYSTDNGNTWDTIGFAEAVNGSYNWTVPDIPSDECLVRISGTDGDNSPYDVSDAVFSITSP